MKKKGGAEYCRTRRVGRDEKRREPRRMFYASGRDENPIKKKSIVQSEDNLGDEKRNAEGGGKKYHCRLEICRAKRRN